MAAAIATTATAITNNFNITEGEEETRLGIDPPRSYLYGCRFADDDDDDDDIGNYLNACPVTAAALIGHDHDEDGGPEQEHPWDEDWDIPLLPVNVKAALQIKGYADRDTVTRGGLGASSEPRDDDSSDCPTVKQGNRRPEQSNTTGGAQTSEAASNKDESDGEESDDTATTEEEDEDEEDSPARKQEQQQQHLQDRSVGLKRRERTNSWFRSWWKDSSSHEPEHKEDNNNQEAKEEDEIIVKEPSAIVLEDCDHDGFALESALTQPTFLDRQHWQQQSSNLNEISELDDDLEYEAQKVIHSMHQHQHFLLSDLEDCCSEIEHDDDENMIEIVDSSDDSEDLISEERADSGVDNNNNNSAPSCTSPPNAESLVLLKSSLKKNREQTSGATRSNGKNRVSFNIPRNSYAAADAAPTSDAAPTLTVMDNVIVTVVDTTMPPTTPKWKLRQRKTRTICNDGVEREVIVHETQAKKNKSSSENGDFFNSRNMKLLRRFRNRAAVKLLNDYQ